MQYIKENYKPNEPIFASDIELPLTDVNLRQKLKMLCDNGDLCRYDAGVYYYGSSSKIKGATPLSSDEVAYRKYIDRKNSVEGYYSGYSFANQLGLSTQVPFSTEIVSNLTSAKVRKVSIKGRKLVIRKPRVKVDAKNASALQMLDLLKDLEIYSEKPAKECRRTLAKFIKDANITKTKFDECLEFYPERTYKNLYKTGLYEAFA
ncbi:MAG: hypothetical protein HUJ63_11220 [Enterococcus sp.]|nr:hypothetical protein [Enterococcus sp.]